MLPSAVCGNSSFFTYLKILGIVSLLKSSHYILFVVEICFETDVGLLTPELHRSKYVFF